MLDATICARSSAQRRRSKKKRRGQRFGRSRGGLTTKIHALVDALGNPVAFSLTPGQLGSEPAEQLIENFAPEAFLADKAYDAGSIEFSPLRPEAFNPSFRQDQPPRSEALRFHPLLRTQSPSERFLQHTQHFRAIATLTTNSRRNFLSADTPCRPCHTAN